MTYSIDPAVKQTTLQANITFLRALLSDAATIAVKAECAVYAGSVNEAIGWLLDIDVKLTSAKALFDATLFIHQRA